LKPAPFSAIEVIISLIFCPLQKSMYNQVTALRRPSLKNHHKMNIQSLIKTGLSAFFLILTCSAANAADTLQVCSPSGKICVKVWMGKQPTYNMLYFKSM
jgi:hypothetical protein